MHRLRVQQALLVLALVWTSVSWSKPDALNIYLNADASNMTEAITAIERGIQIALEEEGNEIHGIPLEFKVLDHRGNAARQKLNSQKILSDPSALLMFTGIHSTTIIPNRSFINENKLLTLVPWAAGGPVTRHPSRENWIFRLSIDDAQAGEFLVDYAIETRQCMNPHLLLESSPWGESNLKSMGNALKAHYGLDAPVTRFGYDISLPSARIFLRKILKQKHDCVLLVANNLEARVIMTALESLPESDQLKVISHWGVTTGAFWKGIPEGRSADTDMRFIQTCFSYNTKKPLTPLQEAVYQTLTERFPDITQARDLRAQVGFVHAYDLTRLMISALQNVELGDDMEANRDALRLELEGIAGPVEGLIKSYENPFSEFDLKMNPNGHDALGPSDYCMAHFDADGIIYLEE